MKVSLLKNKMFPLTFPLLIGAMLQREVCTADMGPAATPLLGLRVDVLNGITQLIGCRPGAHRSASLGQGEVMLRLALVDRCFTSSWEKRGACRAVTVGWMEGQQNQRCMLLATRLTLQHLSCPLAVMRTWANETWCNGAVSCPV